jgi:hypothetical protein
VASPEGYPENEFFVGAAQGKFIRFPVFFFKVAS